MQLDSVPSSPAVAVFDLDGTLTWRDTLLPFLLGYLLRHPTRWPRLWRIPFALVSFLASNRDRGLLKSRMIRMAMQDETRATLDVWADAFVVRLRSRGFRPAALAVLEAHRAAGDHLVLLSASPDLYVPRIARLLGFERTVCTEVAWRQIFRDDGSADDRLDGALRTANRRGEEKSRCLARLRGDYPGLPFIAYGNSASDLPHLAEADGARLVNGNAAARRGAAALDMPIDDWK